MGTGTSDVGREAFRWTEATGMIGLGPMPGAPFGTFGRSVSADGSVIAGHGQKTDGLIFVFESFRWTAAGGIVPLGDLPGGAVYSETYDMSADGSVVVGQSVAEDSQLPFRAFRWTTQTGMVALPDVPNVGPAVRAEGISGDGNVIVGTADEVFRGQAFAWDAFHGSRSIANLLVTQGADVTGWNLGVARATSYDGLVIAGFGTNPDGNFQPWVARLDPSTFIPEPGALGLGAVAFFTSLALWRSVGTAG